MEKRTLDDIFLPPMPEALTLAREELARSEPDITRVAQHIASDVGLAAEVLKVVNSPSFGRSQKITSVSSALLMLGLRNVLNITNGVALRAMTEKYCRRPLDRFWDSAGDVALASAVLAGELTGIHPELAYTVGLMHDSGIPILLCNSDSYAEFIGKVQRHHAGEGLLRMERQRFGVDHAAVGALVAQKWYMPEEVVLAVRYHHSFPQLVAGEGRRMDDSLLGLLGVLKMAEHVSNAFRGLAFRGVVEDLEWETSGEVILAYFDYSLDDFEDRKLSLFQLLGER